MIKMRRVASAITWRANYIRYELGVRYRRLRLQLYRISGPDLAHTFWKLGRIPSGVLMVHSSLSACGIIAGVESTVISELCRWVRDRTLVMPPHSYCYPDTEGRIPVYDRSQSSSQVGAIAVLFWRLPGVIRSNHPMHSV